jgi:uncharacterized protein
VGAIVSGVTSARRVAAALAFALALALPEIAAAQSFPPLTGRVVDEAGIIPDADERALTERLAAHEAKTTNQVVVATVRSLGGRGIEEYGVDLGRAWGIGQAERNNGAILLVAPNEREVRIEVGYGLEGELTDAISGLIISGSIIPRFRDGDYPAGIAAASRISLRCWRATPALSLRGRASASMKRTRSGRPSRSSPSSYSW